MSNKNKNKPVEVTPPAPEAPETPDAPGTPDTSTDTPPATKEEVKALIAIYVKADNDVDTAKAMYDKAMEVRNAAAKVIHDKAGKGKYRIKGEICTLMSRKSKKSNKESYFFKGQSDDEVIGGDD